MSGNKNVKHIEDKHSLRSKFKFKYDLPQSLKIVYTNMSKLYVALKFNHIPIDFWENKLKQILRSLKSFQMISKLLGNFSSELNYIYG